MSPGDFREDAATVIANEPDFVSYNEVPCRDDFRLAPGDYKLWRPHPAKPRACDKSKQRWYERNTPIAYDGARWEGLDWGTHPITEKWGPKGSAGVHLAVRYANWVTVREKDTGRVLSVVSAHFAPWQYDVTLQSVRSMGNLVEKLGEAGPVLIGGDLNFLYRGKDNRKTPLRANGMTPTFDTTGKPRNGTRDKGTTIDFVLVHDVADWKVLGQRAQNINSDHHALTVDLAPRFGPDPEPEPEPEPDPGVERLYGDNRYATAAKVSADSFPNGAETVFLAAGSSFPDALAGGPAAGRARGPILLANGAGNLPAATRAELERLDPQRIFLLGGTGAVSAAAQRQAAAVGTVERLSGANRYATATRVSRAFWDSTPQVFVASGETYADALAGGALAAKRDAPLLLVRPDGVPAAVEEELRRLAPEKVFVLGGKGAVSEGVAFELGQALTNGGDFERIEGANRYETAANVVAEGWSSAEGIYLASGEGFADALAGVPGAAASGLPLLLTRPGCRPAVVTEAYERLRSSRQVLLGGPSVVRARALDSSC